MSGAAASFVARGLNGLRALRPQRALARRLPALSPRLRRRLLVVLVVGLALSAGYRLWLRDSWLVAVHEVTVTGLTTADAERVRMAVTSAGRSMTTLNVDHELLDRAVAAYPVVRELEVRADFPHGLDVRVVEHHAVALAVSDSGKVPVAGDGAILRGVPVHGRLPTVDVDGVLGDRRLRDPTARAAAAVAGAAPKILRKRIEEVAARSQDGLVAELDDGPELIFGRASGLAAKWAAAARVLADPDARGASYIDLRIPDRPAAGGLPAATVAPVSPAGVDQATEPLPGDGSGTEAARSGAGDPTAAPAPDSATQPPASTTTPPGTTTAPPTGETLPTTPSTPPAAGVQPELQSGAEGGATAPAEP